MKWSARRPSLSDRQGPGTIRQTLNKPKPHHKPNLISLQEPLILQVFSVHGWSLEQSLGLLHVLINYGESGYLSKGKAGFPINNVAHEPRC